MKIGRQMAEMLERLASAAAESLIQEMAKYPPEVRVSIMGVAVSSAAEYRALVTDDVSDPQGQSSPPEDRQRTASPRPKRASRKPGKRRPRAAAAPRVDTAS